MPGKINQHEGKPCKWCGESRGEASETTCVWREAPLEPAPLERRIPAVEDFDEISKRLREIQKGEVESRGTTSAA